MKKITCYSIFILYIINIGFSQENIVPIGKFRDYRDYQSFMEFKPNNRIEKWSSNRDSTYRKIALESGEYILHDNNGLDFLTILWDNGRWGKYLLLITKINTNDSVCFFLYDSNSEPYFIGFRGDDGYYYGENGLDGDIGLGGLNFSPEKWINSTSYLSENGVSYSSEKLGYRIGEAWAYRFGEENIFGTLELNIHFSSIYMSSGFISYSNPELYRQNARPKKIKISWNDNDYEIIELEDTPHFQYIGSFGEDRKIEIVEIYPGTKYQDVCINAFYTGWWQ